MRKVAKKENEKEERKKEKRKKREKKEKREKGKKDGVEGKRSGGIAAAGEKRVSRRKKERFAILSVRFWRERPIKKETLAAIALKWKVCVEFNEKTTKRK